MAEQHELNNLLSVAQAAERLGVNRSAVYQAVRSGRLASVQVGGHIYIAEETADAYTPLPPSARKDKGLSIGGRPVTRTREDKPKRPRGRPAKNNSLPVNESEVTEDP